MRAVVGAVHHERVVGDSRLVERLEDGPDVLVVVDHDVVIFTLPPPRLAQAFRLGVSAEVHVSEVDPDEKRFVGLHLALNEVDRAFGGDVVDRLHPLLGQGTGVLDDLLANLAEAGINSRVVFIRRLGINHPARSIFLAKSGVLGIIAKLRLFLGVEVVKVAEELVESVDGGEKLIAVAEVVLAKLPGRVTQGLEHLGDRWVLAPQSESGARQADLRESGAESMLAGDERGAARRAALFGVIVGEHHAFLGHAVDVGGLVTHHAVGVSADV